MARLQFPEDEIVGTLRWVGSDDGHGPILATGVVDVPDDGPVSLDVMHVVSVEPSSAGSPLTDVGAPKDEAAGWLLRGDGAAVDLSFLRDLPSDSIDSLSLSKLVQEFVAVVHLAPGLTSLYLADSDLEDEVLSHVARLENLVYLQAWGNRFSDKGVQQLVSLHRLEYLYLEEETLTAAAFEFTPALSRLKRLGLMDVPVTPEELFLLRARLPNVDVG
jgi:hypothetical protein